ncbi:PREDICTED: insulin-like growth factor-binding protein complex acid labile subunit, partial [Apaloderma vittatum]|uniref:insulin-like growth factor-binding protein complex acid labile subunit n=1 Tax=Apaloderma vittatum TaxID=57397 RepID=UPI000521C54A
SPTKVSCEGAGLHEFPKELSQGVKYLELSNNFIQNLSGSYMPGFGQLEHLDVRFNQLEAVSDTTLAQLPGLRALLLGSNRLDRNYRANGVLDLSKNRVTSLPAGIFRSAPRLRQLDLSDNYIMEIEEGAFEALEELEVVSLALNSLHCISGFSLTQLRVLNLSHNALETRRATAGLTRVAALDLSNNHLRRFPFAFFHSLGSLHSLSLAGNCLQEVAGEALAGGLFCSLLESLDVRSNNLLALEGPASWSGSLKDVSIAGNPFGCCSLAWLDALRAAGVGVRDLDEAVCTHRDESRNFSAKIADSPRWLCPRPKDAGSLALLVVV